MPSLSFFSSSFLLLQAITPLVFCAAIPGDEEAPNGLNPEAPPRGCDAYGCPDPTYYLQDPTLIPDKTDVFIINFARPGKYQDTPKPDVNKILTDYLSTSSPYLLNQLNVDKKSIPALVNEGVPLLVDAVLSITQSKNVADGGKALQKWSQKIEPKSPCGLFAAAAVPASLIAFDAVYFANNANGVPTTNDLDYFLQPAFGSFSHDNDVSVHYNAKFPDFFSQKRSTNVDRNVYVRLAESAAKYRASPSSAGNPEFKKLVLVLLRQFGQVKQWAAADWVDTAFGLGYLNEYCKVNFNAMCMNGRIKMVYKPSYANFMLSDSGRIPLPREQVRKGRG